MDASIVDRIERIERALKDLGINLDSSGDREIKVSKCVVMDSTGIDRLTLQVMNQVAGLYVKDNDGSLRICLSSQGENGAGLQVLSNSRNVRIELMENGPVAHLALNDATGQLQCGLLAEGSKNSLGLLDQNGTMRLNMGINNSQAGMRLYDAKGQIRQEQTVFEDDNKSFFRQYDSQGISRLDFGTATVPSFEEETLAVIDINKVTINKND